MMLLLPPQAQKQFRFWGEKGINFDTQHVPEYEVTCNMSHLWWLKMAFRRVLILLGLRGNRGHWKKSQNNGLYQPQRLWKLLRNPNITASNSFGGHGGQRIWGHRGQCHINFLTSEAVVQLKCELQQRHSWPLRLFEVIIWGLLSDLHGLRGFRGFRYGFVSRTNIMTVTSRAFKYMFRSCVHTCAEFRTFGYNPGGYSKK